MDNSKVAKILEGILAPEEAVRLGAEVSSHVFLFFQLTYPYLTSIRHEDGVSEPAGEAVRREGILGKMPKMDRQIPILCVFLLQFFCCNLILR